MRPFPAAPIVAALGTLLLAVGRLEAQTTTGGEPTFAVAARDLPRGAVLAAEDIAAAPLPAGRAPVPVARPGWTTRRTIVAGEPLVAPTVSPPDLVEAGQTVQAVWRRGAIELRVAGRATGSAALGERVLVRIDARRRVQGVVVGPALVQIDSPDRSR